MASGGLEELADDLECPICREGLTVPKVLRCRHVFCADCLRHMVKCGKLTCPICRREHVLGADSGGVAALPEPLLIRQLQEKIARILLTTTEQTAAVSPAAGCGFCGGRAAHMCGSCMKSMCAECAESHRTHRVTRNHRLIKISKWSVCGEHGHELVCGYCTECGVGLCVLCLGGDAHAQHAVLDIKDRALVRERTETLQRHLARAARHAANNERLAQDVTAYMTSLAGSYDAAHDHLRALRQEVDAAIAGLHDELSAAYTAENAKLARYKHEVEVLVASERSLHELVEDVLRHGSAPDVIGTCDELRELSPDTDPASVPPSCRVPRVAAPDIQAMIVAPIRQSVAFELEEPDFLVTPPTPPVTEAMSREGSGTGALFPEPLVPTAPDSPLGAGGFACLAMKQVWETTLRRPVTDVVWDRHGPGWWLRAHDPGALCYYDVSGSCGPQIGAGLLQGRGKVCLNTRAGCLATTDLGRRLVCVSRTGEPLSEFTVPGYSGLSDVDYCHHDDHYVMSDVESRCLLVITAESGELVRRIGDPDTEPRVRFSCPSYVYHQSLDNNECRIIVSDAKDNAVHVVSPGGELLMTYGTEGAGERQLKRPGGVCVDDRGRVVVCDNGNYRVVCFGGEGEEEQWDVVLTKRQLGYRAPLAVGIFNDGQYMVLGMEGCEGVVRGFIVED